MSPIIIDNVLSDNVGKEDTYQRIDDKEKVGILNMKPFNEPMLDKMNRFLENNGSKPRENTDNPTKNQNKVLSADVFEPPD